MSLQLLPSTTLQERVATLGEVEARIGGSPNPKFVEEAVAFRGAFQPGDLVIEFCSDRASWQSGLGMAGFLLRRGGADVARLICRMS